VTPEQPGQAGRRRRIYDRQVIESATRLNRCREISGPSLQKLEQP